jgi:hypothetical protein
MAGGFPDVSHRPRRLTVGSRSGGRGVPPEVPHHRGRGRATELHLGEQDGDGVGGRYDVRRGTGTADPAVASGEVPRVDGLDVDARRSPSLGPPGTAGWPRVGPGLGGRWPFAIPTRRRAAGDRRRYPRGGGCGRSGTSRGQPVNLLGERPSGTVVPVAEEPAGQQPQQHLLPAQRRINQRPLVSTVHPGRDPPTGRTRRLTRPRPGLDPYPTRGALHLLDRHTGQMRQQDINDPSDHTHRTVHSGQTSPRVRSDHEKWARSQIQPPLTV